MPVIKGALALNESDMLKELTKEIPVLYNKRMAQKASRLEVFLVTARTKERLYWTGAVRDINIKGKLTHE